MHLLCIPLVIYYLVLVRSCICRDMAHKYYLSMESKISFMKSFQTFLLLSIYKTPSHSEMVRICSIVC